MTRRRTAGSGRRPLSLVRIVLSVGLALLLSLAAVSPAAGHPIPEAPVRPEPAPLAPVPQATESPVSPSSQPSDDDDDEDDDEATASPSPTPTVDPGPRPDPEGDRWIQLAIVGGGSLLGAVLLFMIIGALIRGTNRRRARREAAERAQLFDPPA